jgi:hypothetical protein
MGNAIESGIHTMTCAGCNDCTFQDQDVLPNHHEIHITVNPEDNLVFAEVCQKLGIKSILVHTEGVSGVIRDEAMTSHKFRGTYDEARAEIDRLERLLHQERIVPARIKIETSPSDAARTGYPDGYWEAHLELTVPTHQAEGLRQYIHADPTQYLSRNPSKGTLTHMGFMVTERGYDMDRAQFMAAVHRRYQILVSQGLDIGRKMIEYCWYYSNPEYDSEWTGE